ncbi:MAG: alpha/beta hydrolase [Chloroflexota bacterium]
MTPKTIHANGLDFAYFEYGTGDNLVLCFHGFPDTAHTWSYFGPALADAGYRVIAPFLRGYPPSEIPADADYTGKTLGTDAIALIDAFGAEQAVLIGHDWGAQVVYAATALAPERVSRLVTVAIPHPRAIKFDLGTLWTARHFLTFQLRTSTTNWMKRDPLAALKKIYRRWSPTWDVPDEELAAAVAMLAEPGAVEGVLGYYWSFAEARRSRDSAEPNPLRRRTGVPTLSVFGEDDGAIAGAVFERTYDAFTGPYEQILIPGVGHFPHREAPDDFAAHVLAFLAREV